MEGSLRNAVHHPAGLAGIPTCAWGTTVWSTGSIRSPLFRQDRRRRGAEIPGRSTAWTRATSCSENREKSNLAARALSFELKDRTGAAVHLNFGPTAPRRPRRRVDQDHPRQRLVYLLPGTADGPEAAAFDGSWKPGDFERLTDAPGRNRLCAAQNRRFARTPGTIAHSSAACSAVQQLEGHGVMPEKSRARAPSPRQQRLPQLLCADRSNPAGGAEEALVVPGVVVADAPCGPALRLAIGLLPPRPPLAK